MAATGKEVSRPFETTVNYTLLYFVLHIWFTVSDEYCPEHSLFNVECNRLFADAGDLIYN
jgi:hypothetical protein